VTRLAPAPAPDPAGHEVTRGNVAGPHTGNGFWSGPSQQMYARCSCGFLVVAVTAASRELAVSAHLRAAGGSA